MNFTIILLIIVIILLVATLASIFYYLNILQNKAKNPEEKTRGEDLLLQQLSEMQRSFDQKIGDSQKSLDQKMQESQKMMQISVSDQFQKSQELMSSINSEMNKNIQEVTKGVTEANEAGKQIFGLATSLQDLEKTLKHQKQRGALGEASLELILGNILPPNAYTMQYRFDNGEVVDAAIKTKEGMIPVDAKFSLDNYNRIQAATENTERDKLIKLFKDDLKKRIDETAKYIREKDGTLPFAFMFIPAEGIYYDLMVNEVGALKSNSRSLLDYAYNDKKVIIVSPTTFSAYLQSVLYGFKAFKIEESAKEIQKYVGQLQKHLAGYEEYQQKLGKTISTVVTHYNASSREFKKIDKDVIKITGEGNGIEIETLEKPQLEA